jgi:hypothetical protein
MVVNGMNKKPDDGMNKKPKVGSFILQTKLGPSIGKFKLSTGIYDPPRFNALKLCVKDLYQRGRFADLQNLKQKKITSIQLLDAYENDSIREDDWSTRSQDLFPSWRQWLDNATLADTTRYCYGTCIRLLEKTIPGAYIVSQLPMLLTTYRDMCEADKAYFRFNNLHNVARAFIRDTSMLGWRDPLNRHQRRS